MLALTEPLCGAVLFNDLAENDLPTQKKRLVVMPRQPSMRVLPPDLHPGYTAALLLIQLNMLTQERADHLAFAVMLVFLPCWGGSEQLQQVLEPL